jgi:hypothetical protein
MYYTFKPVPQIWSVLLQFGKMITLQYSYEQLLEDLVVTGTTISKRIKKWDTKARTGFILVRVGTPKTGSCPTGRKY